MEKPYELLKLYNRAALARQLGISRVTLYNWQKIPAERVVEIEKLTGISRSRLRPDLYEGMKNDQNND